MLPADFSIYLHHPTVTDPSMAPPGMSTFYALIPVAHTLGEDWKPSPRKPVESVIVGPKSVSSMKMPSAWWRRAR